MCNIWFSTTFSTEEAYDRLNSFIQSALGWINPALTILCKRYLGKELCYSEEFCRDTGWSPTPICITIQSLVFSPSRQTSYVKQTDRIFLEDGPSACQWPCGKHPASVSASFSLKETTCRNVPHKPLLQLFIDAAILRARLSIINDMPKVWCKIF